MTSWKQNQAGEQRKLSVEDIDSLQNDKSVFQLYIWQELISRLYKYLKTKHQENNEILTASVLKIINTNTDKHLDQC